MQSESAVVSITLQPALDRLQVRELGQEASRSGRLAGRRRSTPVDRVLGHQDRLGADLERPQRGGRVGGEVRVAGAGREDDDRALLEVPDRPAADVRLGDLGCGQRREDAGVRAAPLERVLEREGVQQGREHPRVVRGRAVHALRGGLHAAVDVPRADHDRDLDARARAHRRSPRRSRRSAPGRGRTRCSPISASPESLSSTRWNAGAARRPCLGRGNCLGHSASA